MNEEEEDTRTLGDVVDTCAQCGMPIPFSYTGRDDLLCEYHAGE
jgi:hypothetical protein